MKLLLEAGNDVNTVDSNGRTPLMTSMIYVFDAGTRLKYIKQLLAAGASINQTDVNRKSPLTYACVLNQTETVEFLLDQVKNI